jgi:hypothetical protein
LARWVASVFGFGLLAFTDQRVLWLRGTWRTDTSHFNEWAYSEIGAISVSTQSPGEVTIRASDGTHLFDRVRTEHIEPMSGVPLVKMTTP